VFDRLVAVEDVGETRALARWQPTRLRELR
jgi:hypothetical protein